MNTIERDLLQLKNQKIDNLEQQIETLFELLLMCYQYPKEKWEKALELALKNKGLL